MVNEFKIYRCKNTPFLYGKQIIVQKVQEKYWRKEKKVCPVA